MSKSATRKHVAIRVGIFSLLTWLIMAPLLRPGFVFALDMAPTPVWRLPDHVTSSYLFYALMHVLNFVIPGDILQKLLLASIFMTMGLGGYHLSKHIKIEGRAKYREYAAYLVGLLYVLNPYVYARFMSGQFAVLLGYALLPWFAVSLLRLLRQPTWQQGVRTGVWLAIIGIVSIHTIGLCAILLLIGVGVVARQQRRQVRQLTRLARAGGASLGTFVAISSYWLVPLVLGHSTTAQAISGFGGGDQHAFATLGNGAGGQLANTARLEGFWTEQLGLFRLPQSLGPLWWLALIVVGLLIIAGVGHYWRVGKRLELMTIGGAGVVAWLLAAGIGSTWLGTHLPFFAGYREPHKFAGLLALGYAGFFGSGIVATLDWIDKRRPQVVTFVILGVSCLPLLLSPYMLLGGHGQLTSRGYPAGWYHVNQLLSSDEHEGKVVFLPWHLYMHFSFAGTSMANPATNFFDRGTLTNNNPEFGHSTPNAPDVTKDHVTSILRQAAGQSNLGAKLTPLGVRYVILANEADVDNYGYVAQQRDLQLVYRDNSIALYENTAWQGGR